MNSATWRAPFRRLFLPITFCLLAGPFLCAQTWTWAGSFGGSGSDVGVTVRISPSGERYLTGYFSASATFEKRTLVSAGDTDVFLAKFGQWVVQISGVAHDEGSDIALDNAGNVYLTGWFTNRAIFQSTDGVSVTRSGLSETIFLAKYSSTGVVQWVQSGTVSSVSINRGHGVAVDPVSGAVYLTGMSQGSTVFSSSNGSSNTVPGPGGWHMYLVKYHPDGNFQWGEWNEATVNSVPHKVAADALGNAYVTGWFEGQATFHSMNGLDQTVVGLSEPIQSAPDYPDDSFVVKYDSNGNLQWVNDIGGYKAIMNDITVSASGNISVSGLVGNINGTSQQQETLVTSQSPGTTINVGGGTFTSPYNRDILVATYDSSGVALNAARIGGTGEEDGGRILASGEDLYVSGVVESTNHLIIGKFTQGLEDWASYDGGPISAPLELPAAITMTREGLIVVAGGFVNTANFGSHPLTSNGAEDGFMATLSLP